jgi:cation diffusion facilitator family transporter
MAGPFTERAPLSPRFIRLSAIMVALTAGILIFGIKLYAANISNSSAIRSDALEGTVNILAAAFGLFSILFSEKPADHDHPYGHGKIEHFAAVFEGGLISLAGFLILIDTASRYFNHSEPSNLGKGLLISFAAGALNGVIGITIYYAGKKYDSTTLRSDGLHLLSDFWSTLGLSAGLGLALYTGWTWIDPILAIAVGIMLFVAGYKVFKPSWNTLLDAVNPELIQKIVEKLNSIKLEPAITIHELKMQEFGRDAHVDLHIVVPEFFTIKEAHHISDRIVKELQITLGSNSMIHAHMDPCAKLYCNECNFENCPIRKQPFTSRKPLTMESIVLDGPI